MLHTKHQSPLNNPKFPYQNTEMYHVGSIQMPQNDHHAMETSCTLHTKPLAKHSYLSRQHCKLGLIHQNTEMYHVGSIQMPQNDHHAINTYPEHQAPGKAFISLRIALQLIPSPPLGPSYAKVPN